MTPAAIAYSYIRFSSLEQAKGDSLRRQTDVANAWCKRNKVRLDTSLTLHDLGKSAYTGEHRKNPDRHALAALLKLVEGGKVPRGSYLIVESLDRLSREHIRPALTLLLNLIEAGIRIVQLLPVEAIYDDKVEPMNLMMAIMELSRGHSESAVKSERIGAAWQRKKKRARENRDMMTRQLPAWIEEHDGEMRLVPERAALVKRIFALAAAGYGNRQICKRFVEEGVVPFGKCGRWQPQYLGRIMSDRRAVGELQPQRGSHNKNMKKDGPPIPSYYPAVVTEQEWLAARAGAAQRHPKHGKSGRLADQINPFTGLLRDARTGNTYFHKPMQSGEWKMRFLINTAWREGTSRCYSFPYDTFETAVLSLLSELDSHEILNGDHEPDPTTDLAKQFAGIEGEIAKLEDDLARNGHSDALSRALRRLEDQKRSVAEQLAEARQKAANPLGEAWGEAQTIIEALEAAPDPQDARLRLRSALRRLVDSIWLLVVPRGSARLCAVQIWFAGGKRVRSYLILNRKAINNGKTRTEGGRWARSLADVAGPRKLDLRQRTHTTALEKVLERLDLTQLEYD
jgi:DNA invertase Pin-like site-specific DNA recombinase